MQKKFISVTAVLIVLLAGLLAVTGIHAEKAKPAVYGQQVDGPRVIIKAPAKVKVGELIVLDLSESHGAGFDFIVKPVPPNTMVFDEGKTIVCSTGSRATKYTFFVSCAKDGKSSIATHEVRVVGEGPPPPPPKPGDRLIEKVQEWANDLVESKTKYSEALKLSQSFNSIAIVTEQGTFSTPSEMVKATKTSNKDALKGKEAEWQSFMQRLMTELQAMAKANLLPDMGSHAKVWREIATGLKQFAESNPP